MSIRQELAQLSRSNEAVRSFGWSVGGAFLALWLVFIGPVHYFSDYAKGGHHPALMWIGVALIVLGTILPVVLRPIYILWMGFAFTMGFFMTRVILTIFYFVVLTPVGLFFRLIGRDALQRKIDRQASTYWIEKEYPIADRSRYENFF